MLTSLQSPYYRRSQQAFKIDKQAGIYVAKDIAHRESQPRVGKRDSNHRPADDHNSHQNPQHIRRSHSFMPHQNDITQCRQNCKHGQQISRPPHKGLC